MADLDKAAATRSAEPRHIRIALEAVVVEGILTTPPQACALVLFAHGSGSSRLSSRNRFVAETLHREGIATLLFDLLTAEEEVAEQFTRHLRFDIGLLAGRLLGATKWAAMQPDLAGLPLGYFGASTGAAAALVAAAEVPVGAVVSRGGRPDLAGAALERVTAPTLLIVGGEDTEVIALNRQAQERMTTKPQIKIVPGATHLFEEPGTLEKAAWLAASWFKSNLCEDGRTPGAATGGVP